MSPVGFEAYLDRLGPRGLRLVLAGLLAPDDCAALAGEPCPEDAAARADLLADRLAEDPSLAPRLLALLDERTADTDDPAGWDERRTREALAALIRDPGPGAAALLHRLARAVRPPLPPAEIRATGEVIAGSLLDLEQGSRPKWQAKVASERAGLRELEQERRELEARLRQVESRLQRALERNATLEERLARRLAEVHELRRADRAAREERRRLEQELARLHRRVEEFNEKRARERTGELLTALRRLTTEQRRAASFLERIREERREERDAIREQAKSVQSLAALVEKMITLHEAESRAAAAAQEAILRELALLRGDREPATVPLPRRRGAGAPGGKEQPRVALFVDVQNMFYGAKEKNARLDFEALLAAAADGRRLVRAVAYVVESREIDQSAFIHLLRMKAYEVKRKPLRIRPDRSMKGNWDLEMALDALATGEHVDVIVLVTGDGDFVPLVRQLRLKGVRVEIYGFPRSTAPDLRQAADRFVPITRKLLRPLSPRRPRRAASPAAEER